MNFLALDTSSNACSVAVQVQDRVVHQHVVEARVHTQILLPMISALLEEAGIALQQLDAIILGNGPGSFIGVRIGASVAQGLSFGIGVDIVPLSSLAVIAAEVLATSDTERVVVAQDARMNEVYLAQFLRAEDGLPLLVDVEKIVATSEVALPEGDSTLAGGAWERYAALSSLLHDKRRRTSHVLVPDARFLLPPGVAAYGRGQRVAAEKLLPAYLRNKVAEVPAQPA